MSKSHFVITKDENGDEYVVGGSVGWIVIEQKPQRQLEPTCLWWKDARHARSSHLSGCFIPEICVKASPMFETVARTRDFPGRGSGLVLFCNSPIGEKTFKNLCPRWANEHCKLSERYSNHSIRATGATILTKLNYQPAQIMSVTGHKSASSLTVYQNVDDAKKVIKL